MTTPTAAVAARPAGQQAAGQAAPAPRPYPYPVGMYDNEAQDGGTMTLLQTTAPQQLPIYNITPTGWVRGVWFDFTMKVTANVANVVSYSGDNPFSGVQKVTLRDLGQQAIIGPIGGYDW